MPFGRAGTNIGYVETAFEMPQESQQLLVPIRLPGVRYHSDAVTETALLGMTGPLSTVQGRKHLQQWSPGNPLQCSSDAKLTSSSSSGSLMAAMSSSDSRAALTDSAAAAADCCASWRADAMSAMDGRATARRKESERSARACQERRDIVRFMP